MDQKTKDFIENKDFDKLFKELSKKHKPIKAKLDNERLEGIGLIIVKFQRLEFTIKEFISFLCPMDKNLTDILIIKNSFEDLLNKLSALVNYKIFSEKENLSLLINQCKYAEDIRNKIIHSVWTAGPRIKANLKKNVGLKYQFEKYKKGELKLIASKIDNLDTAIDAMKFKIIGH